MNIFKMLRSQVMHPFNSDLHHFRGSRILSRKMCLILSVFALAMTNVQSASAKVTLSPHPKLVIFSFDGFRFDYIHKAHTPVLDSLRVNGVSTDYMKAQFVTKTFVNHQSIATGMYPEIHGVTDNILYDPVYGRVLTGREAHMEEFWVFDDNVVPAWIINEWTEGRFSGAAWPGSNHPYGANRTSPTHFLTYDKTRPFEERMDIVISWLTNETAPANLIYMYFDEPDDEGHRFGPESPEVVTAIERMDEVTGYFIDQLKELDIFDDVNIIILSDHGFHEVSTENVIPLSGLADPSYYALFGGSPVIQVLPYEGKFYEIYSAFKRDSVGQNFTVYTKSELPDRWRWKNNRRVMPIVLVANEGYVFDDYIQKIDSLREELGLGPEELGTIGVHGYDNEIETMRAFFLAHGPAFKRGVRIPPIQNIDVFPLVCKIMDLHPPSNNGSLERISEALSSSHTTYRTSIRSFSLWLLPTAMWLMHH